MKFSEPFITFPIFWDFLNLWSIFQNLSVVQTSNSGSGKTKREDRATQLLICETLSLAMGSVCLM